MAPQDVALAQIIFALARGTGSLRLSAEAAGWFHDRYAPWLVARKPGHAESPLEIWVTQGRGFLGRFRAIGQGARALAPGDEIGLDALRESVRRIEAQAPCPWCPEPMAHETVDEEVWTAPFARSSQDSLQAHA